MRSNVIDLAEEVKKRTSQERLELIMQTIAMMESQGKTPEDLLAMAEMRTLEPEKIFALYQVWTAVLSQDHHVETGEALVETLLNKAREDLAGILERSRKERKPIQDLQLRGGALPDNIFMKQALEERAFEIFCHEIQCDPKGTLARVMRGLRAELQELLGWK